MKGIIGMHRFNICLVVVLSLTCSGVNTPFNIGGGSGGGQGDTGPPIILLGGLPPNNPMALVYFYVILLLIIPRSGFVFI